MIVLFGLRVVLAPWLDPFGLGAIVGPDDRL